MKVIGLASLFVFFQLVSSAQIRCGSDEIKANRDRLESMDDFNGWIDARIVNKNRSLPFARKSNAQEVIYEVPVVFHIIHNGQPIGTGPNIEDARIIDQLKRLNDDFRRLNADSINTPLSFQNVAADTKISFVLAKQDPQGIATSGITRTQYVSQSSFKDSEVALITSIVNWPPEDYINIYIIDLESFLGFAIFPFTDLDGLRNEIRNFREIDGVFVRYSYFGFNDNNSLAFTSYGRTLTHEMGHYLGVLHTFHNGCFGNGDHCEDTPALRISTLNINERCNSIPNTACDEEERPMVENYMDYTDDVCMNLFTQDQKERMRTVLEFSPRRKSLLTSPALSAPTVVANDLGILEIRSPLKSDCSSSFTPSIQVRNYGSTPINNFRISIKVNDELKERLLFNNTLSPSTNIIVSLSPINITSSELSTVTFEVAEVNGMADGNASNNVREVIINPSETSILPYNITFETNEALLAYTELHTESNWETAIAPTATALNKAAALNFFEANGSDSYGIKDLLVSDILDVSTVSSAQLTFNYAYSGRSSGEFLDELIVAVSTDCGNSFHEEDYIFSRRGNNLISAPRTDVSFIPSSEQDWERIDLNITPYLEFDEIQIAFIGVNGGGNNLYLDDIAITSSNLPAYDLGIRRISNVTPVTCLDDLSPTLNIRNFGFERITKMVLSVSLNGAIYNDTLQDFSIRSGESEDFRYRFGDLFDGENNLKFKILSINDVIDEQPMNDTISYRVIINKATDVIPIRETFEEGIGDWVITEANSEPLFESIRVSSRDNIIRAFAYDSGTVGSQTYLVSPNLNTNDLKYGAIRFRVSHARRLNYVDNLRILLSVNCGASYDIEVYNRNSEDIASALSNDEVWIPDSDEDWINEFVDITDHMIWSNLRIAFVFTNGQGNNLYLDDIEFLTSNDPNQITPEFNFLLYPNPAEDLFHLSFKLPKKQTVNFKLIDLTGKIVIEKNLENVLNQKYDVITPTEKGMYLLVVKGADIDQVKRVYIR